MTDREMLNELVRMGTRFRNTPIVDNDFVSVKNQFDYVLNQAVQHLETRPVSIPEPVRGCVLQDWVLTLGLRHQGVLVSAIRGPDNVPKEDPAKSLVRTYRSYVLNCFCGDPAKASSFIEAVDGDELVTRQRNFRRSFDHYPIHFVLHLVHAAEIVGYKHPDAVVGFQWRTWYQQMCYKMHMQSESEEQLDARLNADEDSFKKAGV